MNIREILSFAAVVPQLTFSDPAQAVPAAKALVAGGLRVLEVTLRSASALGCVEAIRKTVPEALVGVGGLTRPADFAAAQRGGAQFGVSPGLTPEIAAAARGARFPLLPSVMTPSEVIAARQAGFDALKMFPTLQAGGTSMLHVLATEFPDVMFLPSGNITHVSAREYLALPNVISVSGAWMATPEMLVGNDWQGIETLARQAANLKSDAGPPAQA